MISRSRFAIRNSSCRLSCRYLKILKRVTFATTGNQQFESVADIFAFDRCAYECKIDLWTNEIAINDCSALQILKTLIADNHYVDISSGTQQDIRNQKLKTEFTRNLRDSLNMKL